MFEIIEKLRQKSDRTKTMISFLVAFLFSGIIFVIWLSVILPDSINEKEKKEYVKSLEPSPMNTFTEGFKESWSLLNNNLSESKDLFNSILNNFK